MVFEYILACGSGIGSCVTGLLGSGLKGICALISIIFSIGLILFLCICAWQHFSQWCISHTTDLWSAACEVNSDINVLFEDFLINVLKFSANKARLRLQEHGDLDLKLLHSIFFLKEDGYLEHNENSKIALISNTNKIIRTLGPVFQDKTDDYS